LRGVVDGGKMVRRLIIQPALREEMAGVQNIRRRGACP
jgi:hypothetical protein